MQVLTKWVREPEGDRLSFLFIDYANNELERTETKNTHWRIQIGILDME